MDWHPWRRAGLLLVLLSAVLALLLWPRLSRRLFLEPVRWIEVHEPSGPLESVTQRLVMPSGALHLLRTRYTGTVDSPVPAPQR